MKTFKGTKTSHHHHMRRLHIWQSLDSNCRYQLECIGGLHQNLKAILRAVCDIERRYVTSHFQIKLRKLYEKQLLNSFNQKIS